MACRREVRWLIGQLVTTIWNRFTNGRNGRSAWREQAGADQVCRTAEKAVSAAAGGIESGARGAGAWGSGAGTEHIPRAATDQHGPLQWAGGLRAMRDVRGLRLPNRREERHAKHDDSAGAGDRAMHADTGAMVQRIHTDDRGHASGVSFFVNDAASNVHGRRVVCSAGAIESARLLLNSATSRHPRGLGNDFDQVGRHLQGHIYTGAFGVMPEPVFDGRGPGVSIATTRFNHHNPGIVGGGLLANEFIKLPAIFVKWAMPPGRPRWGLAAKQYVRENYRRTIHVPGTDPGHSQPRGACHDRSVRARSLGNSGGSTQRNHSSREHSHGRLSAAPRRRMAGGFGGEEGLELAAAARH